MIDMQSHEIIIFAHPSGTQDESMPSYPEVLENLSGASTPNPFALKSRLQPSIKLGLLTCIR